MGKYLHAVLVYINNAEMAMHVVLVVGLGEVGSTIFSVLLIQN